ncbi:MAG: hypothetical protein JXR51_03685 [Bacteroidales bacterium]|nr:hypothetical protein [Bacteroidales bacterium]MBN2756255.1 hypothetical protein [Bacteroidales bacterium]
MQKLVWIYHKGKKILHSDHGRFGKDAKTVILSIETAVQLVKDSGEKEILLLEDLRNLYVIPEIFNAFKKAGKEMEPYTKKTAEIGLEGSRKIFLSIMNRITSLLPKHFETFEEALEWLVDDN